MEKRSQATLEYLLILAAALVVAASVTYLLFSASGGLGADVEGKIEGILKDVIEVLT